MAKRITSGDREEIDALAEQIHNFVFCTCDSRVDLSGDDAGRIAAASVAAARRELEQLLAIDVGGVR